MDKGSFKYFTGQIVALGSAVVKVQSMVAREEVSYLIQCINTGKQPDLLTIEICSQLTYCQS